VLFLPHILDSGAASRNQYLETYAEIAKDFRKMPFSFAWSEANAQSELESVLTINNNYPTLAVLSAEKKVYAVPKVSWNAKNIKAFLNGVLAGSEKIDTLSSIPKLSSVTAWDGKDGVLEVEEMSLDDLFGDDA